MKYLSLAQIQEAISRLAPQHVFFGTTFLVLKQLEAPVGSTIRLSLDKANAGFLGRYYRLHPKSEQFFVPLGQKNPWRKPRYPSTSLQAVNTQMQPNPLIHVKKDNVWGWDKDYVRSLAAALPGKRKIPLFHLAAWIYRENQWENEATRKTVLLKFCKDFHLTQSELGALFFTDVESEISEKNAFQSTPARWQDILQGFDPPEDVPPDGGATLQLLEFSGLGPIRRLHLHPAPRLNIITGDNGLGKTFLLDIIWWALTREWANGQILPFDTHIQDAEVKFLVGSTPNGKVASSHFEKDQWIFPKKMPAVTGLVVYARVDGSFSVWDPTNVPAEGGSALHQISYSFTRDEVWDGNGGNIEGLIRDWVKWQGRPDKYTAFKTFEKVLRRVSPPDLGDLTAGEPVRLRGEKREIPTLKHPYGTVPILHESAGIRRVVTLAYLIVWAWEEHKIQAKQLGKREERQMVIILDEAEAHLHPKWQRVLLPAMLGIASDLHEELGIQFFVATHSPLVLASAEPVFDGVKDKLFHLNMSPGGKISFEEHAFNILGSSDSWLESDIFGLRFARSRVAEDILRKALALLEKDKDADTAQVKAINEDLTAHIAPGDPFWMRWMIFAAQHGIEP